MTQPFTWTAYYQDERGYQAPAHSDLSLLNRGLRYGDGIFETILYRQGQAQHLALHRDRASAGLAYLGLDVLALQSLSDEALHQALNVYPAQGYVLSWYAIRRHGAFFTPSASDVDILLAARPIPLPLSTPLRLAVDTEPSLLAHSSQQHKTLANLPYVLAAQKARTLGVDNLLLLNHQGNLAEASNANIVYGLEQDDTFYTPGLDQGCRAGIMRRALMARHSIQERALQAAESSTIAWMLCCNVLGIKPVSHIDGRLLPARPPGRLAEL